MLNEHENYIFIIFFLLGASDRLRVISCEITHSKNESLTIVFIRRTQSVHPMRFYNPQFSLLCPLVPEKQDVQISSISKNRLTLIGHKFFVYQSLNRDIIRSIMIAIAKLDRRALTKWRAIKQSLTLQWK